MTDAPHHTVQAKASDAHQAALVRIVGTLIALMGAMCEGVTARLPKRTYRAVLRVLRPAEAAVRRLIVVAARGIKVELAPAKPRAKRSTKPRSSGTKRSSSFQLFDPPEREAVVRQPRRPAAKRRAEPRIHYFDGQSWVSTSPPPPAKPKDDGQVSASRLSRRLEAIKQALEDLPAQAKRLARLQARRARMMASPTVRSPLRPGPPPGCRHKPRQEIDWLLWECHFLVIDTANPDTS